jgi:hypothetical protein
MDVAVIVAVTAALEAAGAVYVAVEEVLDNVPPPETVHVTPPGVLSLVTVAVSVAVSVASTVCTEAAMATLIGLELPPHPEKLNAATSVIRQKKKGAQSRRSAQNRLFRDIDSSKRSRPKL